MYTLGKTAECMMGNMSLIKSMDTVYTYGLMAGDMKEIGTTENNMVKVNTFFLMEQLKLACGNTERGLNG